MSRTQSAREKQDYDQRLDALLDYIQQQQDMIRELELNNAVLRSLLPQDASNIIL